MHLDVGCLEATAPRRAPRATAASTAVLERRARAATDAIFRDDGCERRHGLRGCACPAEQSPCWEDVMRDAPPATPRARGAVSHAPVELAEQRRRPAVACERQPHERPVDGSGRVFQDSP
eukprot:3091433-Prymnesium_polylepis.1